MKGINLLKKHRVEWNAMAVVNDYNADYPLDFYGFSCVTNLIVIIYSLLPLSSDCLAVQMVFGFFIKAKKTVNWLLFPLLPSSGEFPLYYFRRMGTE